MRRMGILALVFWVANSMAAIKELPQGKFAGKGYWKDPNGNFGKYTAELHIKGADIASKITLESGEVFEETGTFVMDQYGFYKVGFKNEQGNYEGRGYCGSVWCSTETLAIDGPTHETIAFVDGKIFRIGSMDSEKFGYFMWEDTLIPTE